MSSPAQIQRQRASAVRSATRPQDLFVGQEQPFVFATILHSHSAFVIVRPVVGITTSWLGKVPFGMLAPVAALFPYGHGRAVALLSAVPLLETTAGP